MKKFSIPLVLLLLSSLALASPQNRLDQDSDVLLCDDGVSIGPCPVAVFSSGSAALSSCSSYVGPNMLTLGNQSYVIYLEPSYPDPLNGTALAELEGAVGAWNVANAGFQLVSGGTIPANLATNPNYNVIQYINGICPYAFGCNAATILRVYGNIIRGASFEVYSLKNNGGSGIPMVYTATLAAAGKQRLRGLWLHEFSHFLGFLHPNPAVSHPLTVADPCTNCNAIDLYPTDIADAGCYYGAPYLPSLSLSTYHPLPNQVVTASLNFPSAAGSLYYVITSYYGFTPIPVGTPLGLFFDVHDSRQLLNLSYLLDVTVTSILFPGGFAGYLDSNGQASLQFFTPNIPTLSGTHLGIQAIAFPSGVTSGILLNDAGVNIQF